MPDLASVRDQRDAAGLFLDFDGCLAEIVPRPEMAAPVPGAVEALAHLVSSYRVVAVVTGRRGADVRERLPVPGLEVFGLYGLERRGDAATDRVSRLGPEMERLAATHPGAWVEDKGASLALHYRAAADPDAAGPDLVAAVSSLAAAHGLRALPGKMVVELAPPELPGKGRVILEVARESGLRACLYAGDDLADIEGFASLDRLRSDGFATVKVAVRSEETPAELLEAADVVVERPAGLVALLASLADA